MPYTFELYQFTTENTTLGTFSNQEIGTREKTPFTLLDDMPQWLKEDDTHYSYTLGFTLSLDFNKTISDSNYTVSLSITDISNYHTENISIPFIIDNKIDSLALSYGDSSLNSTNCYQFTSIVELQNVVSEDNTSSGLNATSAQFSLDETSLQQKIFLTGVSNQFYYSLTSSNTDILSVSEEQNYGQYETRDLETTELISTTKANRYLFSFHKTGLVTLTIEEFFYVTKESYAPSEKVIFRRYEVPIIVQSTSPEIPTDTTSTPIQLFFEEGTSLEKPSMANFSLSIQDLTHDFSSIPTYFTNSNDEVCSIEKTSATTLSVSTHQKGSSIISFYVTDTDKKTYYATIEIIVDPDKPLSFKEGEEYTVAYGSGSSISLTLDSATTPSSTTFVFEDSSLVQVLNQDAQAINFMVLKKGETRLFAICTYEDGTTKTTSLHLRIVPDETEAEQMAELFFEEGKDANIFLQNPTKILHLDTKGLDIPQIESSFYCSNPDLVTMRQVNAYTVEVTALLEGEVTIYALVYTSGKTYLAKYSLSILSSVPSFAIQMEKTNTENTTSSFTIYDLLRISLNTFDFELSSEAEFTWLLDGIVLSKVKNSQGTDIDYENSSSIYQTFTEGTHEIQLQFSDKSGTLTDTISRTFQIGKEVNQDRTLSFEKGNQLNLLVNGEIIKISALLDGGFDYNITYTWNIENQSILQFVAITSSPTVVLMPVAEGTTKLTVYATIGSEHNPKIISQTMQIQIDKINTMEVKATESVFLPKETGDFVVLINGKTYDNVTLNIAVTNTETGEKVSFEQDKNHITIKDQQKGKYQLTTSYQDLSEDYSFQVTSFSIQRFLKDIFPYLLFALLVVLIFWIILGTRKANDEIALNRLKKRLPLFDRFATASQKQKVSLCHKLKKSLRGIQGLLDHAYDDGEEELKGCIEKTNRLLLLFTIILSENTIDHTNFDKIKTSYYQVLIQELDEVVSSRKAYQKNVGENKKKDVETLNKKKKASKSDKEIKVYQELIKSVTTSREEDDD